MLVNSVDGGTAIHSRVLKVTPGQLDRAQECLYRLAYSPGHQEGNLASRRGAAIHQLLRQDGQQQLAGKRLLDPVELITHGCADPELRVDREFVAQGIACIAGARRYLADHGLTIMAVERFVSSPPREISGVSGLSFYISGRIDMVARGAERELILLDFKTSAGLPSTLDLLARASTFAYTYLGRCLCSQLSATHVAESIRIVQLQPQRGLIAEAELSRDELVGAARLTRDLIVAIDAGLDTPLPGEQCGYCDLRTSCPAHSAPDGWDTDLLF